MPSIPAILETRFPPNNAPSFSRRSPDGRSTTNVGADGDEGDVKAYATPMHGRWCPGMEEWPWLRGWRADRQQLFLLCFVCEGVHAIMGNVLSELDSCPDVEALSCLVKLTLARKRACIYTRPSSFDMRTASRNTSLGYLYVVFRYWYY